MRRIAVVLALASFVMLAQAQAVEPAPARLGCASLAAEIAERIGPALDDGGETRARAACYEALGRGFAVAEIAEAMRAWAGAVAETLPADGALPFPGDAWVALLGAPPGPIGDDVSELRAARRGAFENVGMHYWQSCDGRGIHGACDQEGGAEFRVSPNAWAEVRYFDSYADRDTAGAVGMGADFEWDRAEVNTGVWIGTWARNCVATSCDKGAPFVLPWAGLRAGSDTVFVDASALEGPYLTSGVARLELGHAFANGSRVEAGATTGIFGHGVAARADGRLLLFRHLTIDAYVSAGPVGWAWGGGAGFRY